MEIQEIKRTREAKEKRDDVGEGGTSDSGLYKIGWNIPWLLQKSPHPGNQEIQYRVFRQFRGLLQLCFEIGLLLPDCLVGFYCSVQLLAGQMAGGGRRVAKLVAYTL